MKSPLKIIEKNIATKVKTFEKYVTSCRIQPKEQRGELKTQIFDQAITNHQIALPDKKIDSALCFI